MLDIFIQLFPIIVPTILIVFLGFIWNKLGNQVDQSEITNIITWVGAPCLIFNTLIKLESSIFIVQDIIVAAILMILIMFLCSYMVLKLFKYPIRPLINTMTFANSGNIGMTISLFAFGVLGLELAVIYFMISSMLHFTIGLSIWSGKWSFKFLLKTPVLYAVLAGLIINFSNIDLPKTITNTTSILSGITIPLLLFTMGISINKISYKIEPKIIILIIIRIFIATSLAYILTIVLDIQGVARNVILLQGVLPAPIFAYLFASQFKINPEKVANYLMTSTFISIFTITIFLTVIL